MDHNKQQSQQPEQWPDVLWDRIEDVFVWVFGGPRPTHTPRGNQSTSERGRGGDRP